MAITLAPAALERVRGYLVEHARPRSACVSA